MQVHLPFYITLQPHPLYGVVEPLTGWHWTQEYAQLNSENFQAFLNDLSVQLGSTVAVMQLELAPAHRAQDLEWPDNIIPIFQPADCPELNPIERKKAIFERLMEGRELCVCQCT